MATEVTLKSPSDGVGRWSMASSMSRVRRAVGRLPGVRRILRRTGAVMPWARMHPFDVTYGTDTSGFVSVDELADLGNEAVRMHAAPYGGSQPSIIRAVLASLPPLDSFTFVDLGCGKGRPLLVASEFPFRDIVGIELSAPLAEVARRNAELMAGLHAKRTDIRIVVGDASSFVLPAGNVVLFLYNPFGDGIVSKVAEVISAAVTQEARTVFVVYYNPVCGHRFDAVPRLRRILALTLPYAADELGYGPDAEDPVVVWEGGIPLAKKDAGADAGIEIVDPRYRVRLLPA